MHRDQFLIINQPDASVSQIYFGMKLYMFRTVPLSIIRSFSLYTQQWYMSYRFADSLRAGSGWSCQRDALISQIYSWNENLHVSDSSSVHHQEFFTVHTAMVYVIHVCWQLVSRIRMERSDDGQRNCPKHVEFHSKLNLRNRCICLIYYKKLKRYVFHAVITIKCRDIDGCYCLSWLIHRLALAVFACKFCYTISLLRRSQWPRGLRRRSAAARLLRLWVRIPPAAWILCLLWVSCVVR